MSDCNCEFNLLFGIIIGLVIGCFVIAVLAGAGSYYDKKQDFCENHNYDSWKSTGYHSGYNTWNCIRFNERTDTLETKRFCSHEGKMGWC